MFKPGFLKLLNQKTIGIIVLIVLACGIIVYSGSKTLIIDKMTNGGMGSTVSTTSTATYQPTNTPRYTTPYSRFQTPPSITNNSNDIF